MWSLIFCLRRRHEPAERLPRLIWSASNGFKSHLKTGLNPRWRFFFSDQNRTQLPFSGSFLWPLCVRPLTLCGVKTAQLALPESPAVPPEPRSWGRCTPTPAAAPPSYKTQSHHVGLLFTLSYDNKLSTHKLSPTKAKVLRRTNQKLNRRSRIRTNWAIRYQ